MDIKLIAKPLVVKTQAKSIAMAIVASIKIALLLTSILPLY
jgi:hypothetical protein